MAISFESQLNEKRNAHTNMSSSVDICDYCVKYLDASISYWTQSGTWIYCICHTVHGLMQ